MLPIQRWIRAKLRRLVPVTAVLALLIGAAVIATSAPALADTGGYPDATATTVNQLEYEWGYPCGGSGQPACTPGYWDTIPGGNGQKYNLLSSRGYYYRNCTDYVAWKLESQGISSSLVAGRGSGGNWDSNHTGVTVTTTPEVGDAAVIHHVYSGDVYGHVAYVEAVQVVNGSYQVQVSQYNWDEKGDYSLTAGRLPVPTAISSTSMGSALR